MNPWEVDALKHYHTEPATTRLLSPTAETPRQQVHDPMIYPGLYSGSGFDLMSTLFQVMSRPNPIIELGPVDCSVAIIVCDLHLPDAPIIYVTDSFCDMTGYSKNEVLGRNCRFLQSPPGRSQQYASQMTAVDKMAIHRMRQAVQTGNEIQVQVTNYKKNGTRFLNGLSIIPISREGNGYRYAVGFQCELS